MDPLVTVFRTKFLRSWPDDAAPANRKLRSMDMNHTSVMPLSRALADSWTTDAHFAAYATPNGYRMNVAALREEIQLRIDVLVLDMDCGEVHGQGKAVPDSWRADIRNKMLAMRAAHPGGMYYETKGGSRIVYRQPVPYFLSCEEDAADWRRDYAITCAYLKRMFDIDADPSCADWTRLFRVPRATRDNNRAPESWPMAGDPHNVASIWFEPIEEDRAAAMELLPRAFEAKQVRDIKPAVTGYSDGYGVLYHALRSRGDVFRQHKSSSFIVRCPNERNHSSGKTGDSSTILFLPGNGDSLGWVHCLHAHCVHMGAKDWLRCFSPHEIDSAREAAGLPARRSA